MNKLLQEHFGDKKTKRKSRIINVKPEYAHMSDMTIPSLSVYRFVVVGGDATKLMAELLRVFVAGMFLLHTIRPYRQKH